MRYLYLTKANLAIAALALVLLLTSPLGEARHNNPQTHSKSIEWKTNPDGVRYFLTCINQVEYIATPNGTGYSLTINFSSCSLSKSRLLKEDLDKHTSKNKGA